MKEMYDKDELLYSDMEDAERIPAQQIKIKISKDKYALIDIKEGGLLKIDNVSVGYRDKRKHEKKYQEVKMRIKAEKIEIKKEK